MAQRYEIMQSLQILFLNTLKSVTYVRSHMCHRNCQIAKFPFYCSIRLNANTTKRIVFILAHCNRTVIERVKKKKTNW